MRILESLKMISQFSKISDRVFLLISFVVLCFSGTADSEIKLSYSQLVAQFARERGFNGIWYQSAQLRKGNACSLFAERKLDVSKWGVFLSPIPIRLY